MIGGPKPRPGEEELAVHLSLVVFFIAGLQLHQKMHMNIMPPIPAPNNVRVS